MPGSAPAPCRPHRTRAHLAARPLASRHAQPAPRLFSTHLFGDMLPAKLLAPDGTGRLVLVLRNLKDVLVSLHFFNGEAKDGWLGNEHGPGSLARFLHDDCPNAYGSAFQVVKAMDALAARLQDLDIIRLEAGIERREPAQWDELRVWDPGDG